MSERKHKPNVKPDHDGSGKSKTESNNPDNLRQVANGSWYLTITFKGRRLQKSLGKVSRTTAKERAGKIRTKISEGTMLVQGARWDGIEWVAAPLEQRIKDVLVKDAIAQFLQHYANERPKSIEAARFAAKPIEEFFGAMRMSQVSPFSIDKYKIQRRKVCECAKPKLANEKSRRCSACKERIEAISGSTVNRELMFLRHLYYKAMEWKWAATNPLKGVKLFQEIARTRYLTEEECQRLLDACGSDLKPLVLIALHTGFRVSELTSLRWPAIDMTRRTITVESRYSKNSTTRTVPMTDDVFACLQQLRKDRDRPHDDLVFVSRYNREWKSWRTAFENAREKAGLPDVHFHDLRHTFASLLAMNNVNTKALSELLGHKDMTMTARYSHLSVGYKREAVATLPKLNTGRSTEKVAEAAREKIVRFAK